MQVEVFSSTGELAYIAEKAFKSSLRNMKMDGIRAEIHIKNDGKNYRVFILCKDFRGNEFKETRTSKSVEQAVKGCMKKLILRLRKFTLRELGRERVKRNIA